MSVAAMSSLPSPLKSPTATAVVRLPPVEKAELRLGEKVPSPWPRRTLTVLSLELAMTRSIKPSLLKSPMATETGASPIPARTGELLAGRNEAFRVMVRANAAVTEMRRAVDKVRLAVQRFMKIPSPLHGSFVQAAVRGPSLAAHSEELPSYAGLSLRRGLDESMAGGAFFYTI